MNADDVLKYGNLTFLDALNGVPKSEWETGGVTGVWSVKEIVAHMTCYELLVAEVLNTFLDGGPTPYLDKLLDPDIDFNNSEVKLRQDKTPDEQLTEYEEAHSQVMALIVQIPEEKRRENGAIPWYGEDYDLDDFIAYINYGQKREHSAEINVFRDKLAQSN